MCEPLHCSLLYCRLNVRMNVARTPHSMRKGSQVFRNAAQLKDRVKGNACIRVIINTWIPMVHGTEGKTLFPGIFWTDKDMQGVVSYCITWSNVFIPRGRQLYTPNRVLLSYPPSRCREPQRRGDLQR